jgi:hypothetical protein
MLRQKAKYRVDCVGTALQNECNALFVEAAALPDHPARAGFSARARDVAVPGGDAALPQRWH